MIKQISELVREKYTLRISDHVVLENGEIYSVCGITVDHMMERRMPYALGLDINNAPPCVINWKLTTPLSIYDDDILNLFNDTGIVSIKIIMKDEDEDNIIYKVCNDKEQATCERFGKYISIYPSYQMIRSNMNISKIQICRSLESLLMGG